MDDGHQEPVVDRHRDPDVHGLLEDHPIFRELAVHHGVLAEGLGDGLDDDRHVADADPFARLVGRGVRLSPANDVAHVDLNHGVGVGDRLLDARHLGGDPLAHLREQDLRVAAARRWDRRRRKARRVGRGRSGGLSRWR